MQPTSGSIKSGPSSGSIQEKNKLTLADTLRDSEAKLIQMKTRARNLGLPLTSLEAMLRKFSTSSPEADTNHMQMMIMEANGVVAGTQAEITIKELDSAIEATNSQYEGQQAADIKDAYSSGTVKILQELAKQTFLTLTNHGAVIANRASHSIAKLLPLHAHDPIASDSLNTMHKAITTYQKSSAALAKDLEEQDEAKKLREEELRKHRDNIEKAGKDLIVARKSLAATNNPAFAEVCRDAHLISEACRSSVALHEICGPNALLSMSPAEMAKRIAGSARAFSPDQPSASPNKPELMDTPLAKVNTHRTIHDHSAPHNSPSGFVH